MLCRLCAVFKAHAVRAYTRAAVRKTLAIIGAVIYNIRVKFMGRTFAYLKRSFWLLAAVIAEPAVAACF